MSRAPALTLATLEVATRSLARRDAGLGRIVRRHGTPPLWARRPGFATLVHVILEQQVSIAAAATLFRRLSAQIPGGMTPAAMLDCGSDGLRALGVTRQKSRYLCELAGRVQAGRLRLAEVARAGEQEAIEMLCEVPGIGPWSAGIYLLMALRRPDVWPPGDLALHKALADLHGLARRPTSEEAVRIAERWSPHRAVAARILWHGYLLDPKR